MAYNSQSAVRKELRDIEIGTVKTPEITALPENKNVKRPVARKAPYFKYICICAFVFGAVMCILTGYSKVNELTAEAALMRDQLEELQSEGNALNAKKEQRFNLEYVENVAVNQLGMVKLDKNQINYVAISNPEKITVAAEENGGSGLVAGIIKSFSTVLEYLS